MAKDVLPEEFRPTATRCNWPVYPGPDKPPRPCVLSAAHGGDHDAGQPVAVAAPAAPVAATTLLAPPRAPAATPGEDRVREIAREVARDGDVQVRKDYDYLVDQVKVLRSALTARLDALESWRRATLAPSTPDPAPTNGAGSPTTGSNGSGGPVVDGSDY
jgi:hypothetical protein